MTLEELQNGQVFLIDKPKHWTSFDVIRKLQGTTKYRKFGHAGTLDPLATGLLIVCCGKKTKTINEYQAQEKEYIADFILGGHTKTYDAEFEPEDVVNADHITLELIEKLIKEKYLGEIEQIPPAFSAIKVKGKRAYELARKNINVKLKARKVVIKELFITKLEPIVIQNKKLLKGQAKVVCSKGTYIRSLFHDIGQDLGVGGYLCDLRRTRIGDSDIENSQSLEELIDELKNESKNTN